MFCPYHLNFHIFNKYVEIFLLHIAHGSVLGINECERKIKYEIEKKSGREIQ